MSKRPYGELMSYRNKLQPIYNYPVFPHEYGIISGHMGNEHKVLDFGCGEGKVRSELLMSLGMDIEYVGIDNDPTLPQKVDFKIYPDIDALEREGIPSRYFNTFLMLNSIEHLTLDDAYDLLIRVNPYINNTIIIMTPNPKCFDYMFADPDHKTFFTHEFLYGLVRHLGFQNVEIWRGKGIYQIREGQFKQDQKQTQLMEMNEMQRKVCIALGLDWMGNILIVGKRA